MNLELFLTFTKECSEETKLKEHAGYNPHTSHIDTNWRLACDALLTVHPHL